GGAAAGSGGWTGEGALTFVESNPESSAREREPGERDRGREDDGVDDVEDAAEAGEDIGGVLFLAVALDEGFRQVAKHAGEADRQAEADLADPAAAERRLGGELIEKDGGQHREREASGGAFPRLLGTQDRRHLTLAEQAAREIGAAVAHLGDEDRQRQGE